MRARSLVATFWLAASLLGGCATSAPKTPSAVHSADPAKPPPVVDRAGQLAAALRSLPRPGSVLDALPPRARVALEARAAGLDAQRKVDASSDNGPLAESMPLLHLASGGSSARALYALATTPAGTVELGGLLGADATASPDAARSGVVAELAQRAALHFLRDRAADVPAAKKTGLVYRLIERAALAVDRRDLALAALEALVELDASADNQLDLARARAQNLDAAGAQAMLQAAGHNAKQPAAPLKLQRAAQDIALATALEPARTGSETLPRARALLHLGRLTDVLALFTRSAEASEHLGLASARAAAQLGGACPGLPPGVGTAALCASAFQTSPDVKSALALLEQAWQSGKGRDEEAVEYYLAIARLLPFMHRAASALDLGAAGPAIAGEAKTLADELATLTQGEPTLGGLSLFVAAMGGALDPTQTATDDALFGKAQAIAKSGGRFGSSAVLAVASLLARRRNVAPLLDALPAAAPSPPARAALDAWLAVTQGKRARMETARGELAEVMTSGGGASLERARLVLTMAEADAALDGSERSLQLLSRVAGQLLSESIPPDLAFRAVLDTAGALSRGGRRERALEVTHDAAGAQVPSELRGLHDLWRLVKGYDRVLRQPSSTAELTAAGQELTGLAAPPIAPSAALWLELWSHELEARATLAGCPRGANCTAAARKLRRVARDTLVTRLGREAAPLVERGFLPGGSVNLAFDFSPRDGLQPQVSFDAAFLAIELPKIEVY